MVYICSYFLYYLSPQSLDIQKKKKVLLLNSLSWKTKILPTVYLEESLFIIKYPTDIQQLCIRENIAQTITALQHSQHEEI